MLIQGQLFSPILRFLTSMPLKSLSVQLIRASYAIKVNYNFSGALAIIAVLLMESTTRHTIALVKAVFSIQKY